MVDPKQKAERGAEGEEGAAKSAEVKSAAENREEQKSSGLRVSRPQIPAVYGIPKHNQGLLP
jgi:hypothetical protein